MLCAPTCFATSSSALETLRSSSVRSQFPNTVRPVRRHKRQARATTYRSRLTLLARQTAALLFLVSTDFATRQDIERCKGQSYTPISVSTTASRND